MLFHVKELQSTKWDRMRINYPLLARILKIKETTDPSPAKKPLHIQSSVYPK